MDDNFEIKIAPSVWQSTIWHSISLPKPSQLMKRLDMAAPAQSHRDAKREYIFSFLPRLDFFFLLSRSVLLHPTARRLQSPPIPSLETHLHNSLINLLQNFLSSEFWVLPFENGNVIQKLYLPFEAFCFISDWTHYSISETASKIKYYFHRL